MASIKVKFRPSAVDEKDGTICFQVIHKREVRTVFSEYHVGKDEWDERRSTVCPTSPDPARRQFILLVRDNISWDLHRFSRIIDILESKVTEYTADDVVDEFRRYVSTYSLIGFMQNQIDMLKMQQRFGTMENYKSALNSVRKFLNAYPNLTCGEVMLDSLNSRLMELYEAWMKNRGLCPNTISFYMRILRAVYNRAVEDNLIEDRHPFKKVYTGIDKTVKRALTLPIMHQIKALDLTQKPGLDYARDIFMLSFMLRGMSFVDMAYLKKTDLTHGAIVYRRRKTGQLLQIKWTPDMQRILKKYPLTDNEFLLPIIRGRDVNYRCAYKNAAYRINSDLKKIALMLNPCVKFTLYSARHSWASLAKAKGISISVISEALGHDSESTTQIYLASLESSVVDKANDFIISLL